MTGLLRYGSKEDAIGAGAAVEQPLPPHWDPASYKLADPDEDDTDYKRILEIFKKYDVRYFFYNGGNDSMDTCNKIIQVYAEGGL